MCLVNLFIVAYIPVHSYAFISLKSLRIAYEN